MLKTSNNLETPPPRICEYVLSFTLHVISSHLENVKAFGSNRFFNVFIVNSLVIGLPIFPTYRHRALRGVWLTGDRTARRL